MGAGRARLAPRSFQPDWELELAAVAQPEHRLDGRELRLELVANRVDRGAVNVELRGDLLERVRLGDADVVVRGADQEAAPQEVEPLLGRGEVLELASHEVVLGAAVEE